MLNMNHRTRQIRARHGASALAYGLAIGLISVVALSAVTTTGDSAEELFTDVADTMQNVTEENVSFPESTPTPTATPTPTGLASCKAIFDLGGSPVNGEYTIDQDGPGGNPAQDVWCDMDAGGVTYLDVTICDNGENNAPWTELGTGNYSQAGMSEALVYFYNKQGGLQPKDGNAGPTSNCNMRMSDGSTHIYLTDRPSTTGTGARFRIYSGTIPTTDCQNSTTFTSLLQLRPSTLNGDAVVSDTCASLVPSGSFNDICASLKPDAVFLLQGSQGTNNATGNICFLRVDP